ncbi:DUF3085 domain-containing protein [Streptomyces sp. NPDC006475]|uniref:DUF3085 domain-containing protein n=1 Tax=Streptomyces sp. NPDC006475 TaxID=3155719 RepID=UPI0033B9E6E4
MSEFVVGARLHFRLAAVLAAAEHAAAATEHRATYQETNPAPALWWVKDDGTYLMSNGTHPEGTSQEIRDRTIAYAAGWGRGTDARSVCGGDDFVERIALCDDSGDADGTPLLDILRTAHQAGHAWLVLEISTDQQQFAIRTDTVHTR